jgi:hypothetical protein
MPPDPTTDIGTIVDAMVDRLTPLLRPGPEPLLDRAALAERLGVGERTVGAMVSREELPPPLLHTSGVARWEWGQVVKFLEARQGRQKRTGRGRYRRPA